MNLLVAVLCALNSLQCFSEAAKILAVVPFPARSHYAPFEPLFIKLAERGHNVTVMSAFRQKEKIPNMMNIDISTNLPHMLRMSLPLPATDNSTVLSHAKFMMGFMGREVCRGFFGNLRVKQLLESDEEFDLIISEMFTTDCVLSFIHKFGAPYVGLSSSMAMPWAPDILANPENPSYIPHYFSHFSDRMNYWQRFLNAFQLMAIKIGYKIYSDNPSYGIAAAHVGPDLPSFDDLRSKVGLLLVNGHHSVTTPRALAPGVKEVGGIHIPSSGPPALPKDLKKYLDSATEGLVYFSIGSQLNVTTFPSANMAIFLRAFAELPQQILWRCNKREMPELPPNVKCIDWAPQLSILCKLSPLFQ